jgi:hypothetical protein
MCVSDGLPVKKHSTIDEHELMNDGYLTAVRASPMLPSPFKVLQYRTWAWSVQTVASGRCCFSQVKFMRVARFKSH